MKKGEFANQFYSCVQTKCSIKQEFKMSLVNQISNPEHIVPKLVAQFKKIFDDKFKTHLNYYENYEKLNEEILGTSVPTLIKEFMSMVKNFMGWIYQDLILQVSAGLNQEDVNPGFVIDSLLYLGCSISFDFFSAPL